MQHNFATPGIVGDEALEVNLLHTGAVSHVINNFMALIGLGAWLQSCKLRQKRPGFHSEIVARGGEAHVKRASELQA